MPESPTHPPEFTALCGEAQQQLQALVDAPVLERGRLIARLRELLTRLDEQIDELDLKLPGFAAEQGALADAYSALQSIDLDRGGPNVERYVKRAIADLQRVASGS